MLHEKGCTAHTSALFLDTMVFTRKCAMLFTLLLVAGASGTSVTICRSASVNPRAAPVSACCTAAFNTSGPSCCQLVNPSWEATTGCMGIEAGFPYLSLDAGMYGNYKLRARGDASSFVSAKVVENLACDPHHSASFDEALNATMVSGDGTYIPPPRTPPPPLAYLPADQTVKICRSDATDTGRPPSVGCCLAQPPIFYEVPSCCNFTDFAFHGSSACITTQADGPHLSVDAGKYGSYDLLANGDVASFVSANVDELLACSSSLKIPFHEGLNATFSPQERV